MAPSCAVQGQQCDTFSVKSLILSSTSHTSGTTFFLPSYIFCMADTEGLEGIAMTIAKKSVTQLEVCNVQLHSKNDMHSIGGVHGLKIQQ